MPAEDGKRFYDKYIRFINMIRLIRIYNNCETCKTLPTILDWPTRSWQATISQLITPCLKCWETPTKFGKFSAPLMDLKTCYLSHVKFSQKNFSKRSSAFAKTIRNPTNLLTSIILQGVNFWQKSLRRFSPSFWREPIIYPSISSTPV